MSVAIPVIDHVDPDLRRIYLKTGVREIHMIDDIYFEMRNLRRVDETLRGWYAFVEAGGNVQKTATTYTPRYLTMLTDPRPITTAIVPADEAHTLIVKGEGITDLGTSGAACFDKTGLVNPVDIEFEPPGAEIIRLDQELIEYASFADFIHVDPLSAHSGTGYFGKYPIGSPGAPVNNMADAHLISMARVIPAFKVYNSLTLTGINLSGNGMNHTITGISPFVILTVDPSANVQGVSFTLLTLIGELDGVNTVRSCSVGPVTGVSGFFEKCAFWSSVDLGGDTSVMECYSQAVGDGSATFNVYEWDLQLRNFRGSATIGEAITGHVSSIGVHEGRITVLASCVGGEIHLRGDPYEFTSAATGTAQVVCECQGELTRELYQIHGLRADSPLIVTPTSRDAGTLHQDITGDGSTSTTVTRS